MLSNGRRSCARTPFARKFSKNGNRPAAGRAERPATWVSREHLPDRGEQLSRAYRLHQSGVSAHHRGRTEEAPSEGSRHRDDLQPGMTFTQSLNRLDPFPVRACGLR